MTYSQLIELKKDYPKDRVLQPEDSVVVAKELLGENFPYSIRIDIVGVEIILFNTHFINTMRQALTDGCVARMGKAELAFWLEFVAYQNDIQDGIRDGVVVSLQREAALEEMSRWISDELSGIPHPEIKECYVPYVGV